MGTQTVPITSAEILAAQAESGMEGVAAYQEAQAKLGEQKHGAVEQALAEATSRGAPAGAMPTAGIAGAYDDRIASMTEGEAIASASASSRSQRMTDYNASVEAARSLIGDEAARAVAPINAQSDFQVRASETAGQRQVDQINAQWRLDKLRLEAQQAAASRSSGGGGGGGGGGGSTQARSMNQSELRSLLTRGAIGDDGGGGLIGDAISELNRATAGGRNKVINTRNATEGDMRRAQAELDWTSSHPPAVRPLRQGDRAEEQRMARLRPTPKVPDPPSLGLGDIAAPVPVPPPSPFHGGANRSTPAALPPVNRSSLPDRPPALNMPSLQDLMTPDQMARLQDSPLFDIMMPAFGVDTPAFGANTRRSLWGVEDGGRPAGVGEAASATAAMRQAMTLAAIQANETGEYNINAEELLAALDYDAAYEPGGSAAAAYDQLTGYNSLVDDAEQAGSDARQADSDARAADAAWRAQTGFENSQMDRAASTMSPLQRYEAGLPVSDADLNAQNARERTEAFEANIQELPSGMSIDTAEQAVWIEDGELKGHDRWNEALTVLNDADFDATLDVLYDTLTRYMDPPLDMNNRIDQIVFDLLEARQP